MTTDPRTTSRKLGPAENVADAADGFRALASRLRLIAQRASAERWSGWTDRDDHTIAAAAAEIEEIRTALAQGMRQAFEIGREYGHREETLDRLNAEIREVSGRLARQAWGRATERALGETDGRVDGRQP